jgi:hypothetical protein
MPLTHLKRAREPNSGELVGIPYVDVADAGFQALAATATDHLFTLPAALGNPPPLVVPTAAVQGDVVVAVQCMDAGGLDAGLGICGGARVLTAGGPGVGQIIVRILNPTAAAIPVAPAARNFRVYLLR